jgi:hypothetical protein
MMFGWFCMRSNKSAVFKRLLIAPSPALVRVLNKFTAEGILRSRITPKDILAVTLFDLGYPTDVSRKEAEVVGGDFRRWGKDDFLFLGRKRKLSQTEQQEADTKRVLGGDVDSPSDYRSHQERVNQIHEKLDVGHTGTQRNTTALFGNGNRFKPLAHGEIPADGVERIGQRLGRIAKNLRLILPNPIAGSRLAVCENETCRKFFIKTRRDKRRCSPECTRQDSARDSNRKRRTAETEIATRKKLRLVRAALKLCPHGNADRKAWVCDRTGVSKKWVTQAVSRGALRL